MIPIKLFQTSTTFLVLLASLVLSPQLRAADAESGRLLYRVNCSQCHGIEGTGKGINAPHLEVAPRNHTDYDEMITRTDEELYKAIAEGGQAVNKSVLMPNWGNTLTDDDINDVIAYLRQICCSKK